MLVQCFAGEAGSIELEQKKIGVTYLGGVIVKTTGNVGAMTSVWRVPMAMRTVHVSKDVLQNMSNMITKALSAKILAAFVPQIAMAAGAQ